jgi:hypothetical protein
MYPFSTGVGSKFAATCRLWSTAGIAPPGRLEFLRVRSKENAPKPRSASTITIMAMATPAFAPADRRELWTETGTAGVGEVCACPVPMTGDGLEVVEWVGVVVVGAAGATEVDEPKPGSLYPSFAHKPSASAFEQLSYRQSAVCSIHVSVVHVHKSVLQYNTPFMLQLSHVSLKLATKQACRTMDERVQKGPPIQLGVGLS